VTFAFVFSHIQLVFAKLPNKIVILSEALHGPVAFQSRLERGVEGPRRVIIH
jgi:hypothetical protein